MVRAAVIGCGDVSVVHLEAIGRIEGSELVAVCDLDPEVARTVGARYGVPGFTDPAGDDRGRPPGRGPDQHAA